MSFRQAVKLPLPHTRFMKKQISIYLSCFFSVTLAAQQVEYPKNYFRSPMDIPLKLSGNFGELRPNHFHAGIDITTSNQQNLPVRAAADGYVTRIKVGPYGYGKALYITHSNGYVTVYGHLNNYNKAISEYLEKEQYSREVSEIELLPRPGDLPVKKGELVAYSGNTGSSGGPHLHFEIRDAQTEEALNPQLFGLGIRDTVAPVIQTIAIFPLDAYSTINGANKTKYIAVKKAGKKYVPVSPETLTLSGHFKVGVECHDFENLRHGKNGVYSIELYKNKTQLYGHRLDRMGFTDSRGINCFIDYAEQEKRKKLYQCSYVAECSPLHVYYNVQHNGSLELNSNSTDTLRYRVADCFGNAAECSLVVKSKSGYAQAKATADEAKKTHDCAAALTLGIKDVCDFSMPEKSIYERDSIGISNFAGKGETPYVRIGNPLVPLHNACSLSIYAPLLPDSLKTKAFLVGISDKGTRSYAGGTFADGKITGTIKSFGSYTIGTDTKAPTVTPSNFDQKGKVQTDFTALKFIGFTVSDNFSGIGTYKLLIDGKWVLLEYEPKKRLLFYTFDEHVGKGEHELVLTVADKKGNEVVYKKSFHRN